jgi:hypothetical protein
MNWLREHRPSPATGIAFAALVVAFGGVAFATIPDSSGTIHACYMKSGGQLRVVDSKSCRQNETALAWSQGSAGAPNGSIGAVLAERDAGYGDPPVDPDPSPSFGTDVTTDHAGKLFVIVTGGMRYECPGFCRFASGLYVDGHPVPKTGFDTGTFGGDGGVSSGSLAVPSPVLTDDIPPGTHRVEMRVKKLSTTGTISEFTGRFAVQGPFADL